MRRHPDRERVQAVLDGSAVAWSELVVDYADLAMSVASRRLRDPDLARDVVADVFESLIGGKLARYDGRSAFSTWLVLIVRNAAIDRLRHEKGRLRLPAAILRRSDMDQRLFELFFVQGWPPEAVYDRVRCEGARLDNDTFWSLLSEMHGLLDDRSRRRLRFDRQAHRLGQQSGRWLEFVDHRTQEARDRRDAISPDADLLAAEESAIADRVRAEVARLSDVERRALTLRFNRSFSAREIADEMQLDNQRQAFTLIERAVRKLRQALGTRPDGLRISLEVDR